ncbi:restriction endonuclease subunit S [Ligilactobacillus murinus]|uniref:Restriction endonuclease subunit S n=1 Tax=Ligilactobacillus murinus TaxID=1622 RepID=A0A4Q2AW76_9LACO|nr:restriction endonuclease subunit S [Ligilactobacillus murinus]
MRFPGFEEPWKTTVLSAIFEKNTKKNSDGAISNVICNSAKQGLIPQREYFDKDIANSDNTAGYYIIEQNDFVYNPRKSADAPYGPISSYKYVDPGIVSPLYLCFRAKSIINPRYYEWYFKSSVWHRYIYMSGDSGARHDRVSIKDDTFFAMPIHLPSENEQRRIASFLDILESRIEKQRTLVDSLKKYKRGVIQHIFHSSSGVGWSYVKLGNIFKKASRRNIDGKIKNVITNSAEYGLIPQRDFFDKNIAVDGNTLNYFVIKTGDFVYNPRKSNNAPYGPFNRYTLKDNGIISPLYTCLVLQADINPSYLAWYFKSDAWHRYIYDNGSQGVRHDRVSMTDDLLMGIPVAIPSADNQRKIARMLDTVETRLLAFQSEYALLEKVRKGFMQQLFI